VLALSMKPTGWFQVAWSGEIPPGVVKPLRYFGHDLIAFRAEDGELNVLDAHCRHLGAHLGYESRVVGDCVECPFHGWLWDRDGANSAIPYQELPSRARLRKWHIHEQHGLVMLWHDPDGGPPREGWGLPDLFTDFADAPGVEAEHHGCYPHAVVDFPDEPIHPQLVIENAVDTVHFRRVHGTPEHPELLTFSTQGGLWHSVMGFRSPKSQQIALHLHTINVGIGLSFVVFDGPAAQHRLIVSATPIDDQRSHLRVSYFLPRDPASPDALTPEQLAFARQTVELLEQDARIWRHQVFVQKPVYARPDVAAYSALRRWSEQFYEVPEGASPTRSVDEWDT